MARKANPLGPWEFRTSAAEYRSEPIDPTDSKAGRIFGTARYPGILVYRLFDQDWQLLYVGIAWNPAERWVKHRRTKPWWPSVAYATVVLFPNELAARRAESRAIKTEEPRFNIHQVPRRAAG